MHAASPFPRLWWLCLLTPESGRAGEKVCCDTAAHGPTGNVACWDGKHFTFERCCAEVQSKPQLSAPRAEADAQAEAEVQPRIYVGVGMFTGYEPGKDCWSGSTWTFSACCDLRHGPHGNHACWDGGSFTFERCCFVGEAPSHYEKLRLHVPKAPLEVPAEEALLAAERAMRPYVGTECWKDGFTWATCCTPDAPPCWDHLFTEEGCCKGVALPPQVWSEVSRSDPRVACLLAMQHLDLDLEQKPRQCSRGRYFHVASSGPPRITRHTAGRPWFLQPWTEEGAAQALIEELKPIGPKRSHFVGGLCVPQSCSLEVTASYLAPRVVPWWRSPRPTLEALNETHVLLSPALARRQQLYAKRGGVGIWIAVRPPEAEAETATEQRSWEFAIHEYSRYCAMHSIHFMVLAASLLTVAAAHFLRYEAEDGFLDPLFHLQRLGLPRGPLHLDVLRCSLTAVVVFMHVLDMGPWLPVAEGSSAAWLYIVRASMNRVNIGFVVLMVHLSTCRRSCKRAASLRGWLCGGLFYAVRRWFVIGPMVATWIFVYTSSPHRFVPLNNLLKSHALQVWYGEARDTCAHRMHTLSSVLLLHEPIMGSRSPCHNADIFEGLFHVDVFLFMLLTALGRSGAGVASAVLWVPSVLYSYFQVESHGIFIGAGHRFCCLLPSGLATLALSARLSSLDQTARAGRPPPAGASQPMVTRIFAGVCIVLPCVQDALTMSQFQWPRALQGAADFFKRLHPPRREYVIPCHVYELFLVLGLLLLLRQGWPPSLARPAASQAREKWSLLRFLSRLSGGICLSNIFVLHFVAAYLHDEPSELSLFTAFAYFVATYLCAILLSLIVLILIEGPFACVLSDGLPHTAPSLPAAAAAA